MRKLLTFIISIAIIATSCLVIVTGDYLEDEEYIADEFAYMMSDYYYCAETYDGYYAESEAPSGKAVVIYLSTYYPLIFENYLTSYNEDIGSAMFTVPADEYEAFVAMFYELTDELLAEIRVAGNYVERTNTYRVFLNLSDWEADIKYTAVMTGYKYIGDGVFETYGFLILATPPSKAYKPTGNAVEGVDYIQVPEIDIDSYGVNSNGDLTNYTFKVGYSPYKIYGAVKSLMKYDEENVSTILSFEKTTVADVNSVDDLKRYENTLSTTEDDNAMLAMALGAYVGFGEEYFENGNYAKIVCHTEYSATYKNALKSVTEKGTAGELYVYELKYVANNISTPIAEPVEVYFAFTETFEHEPTLYFINGEGDAIEVESIVDYNYGVLKASVDQLGKYVIADVDPATKFVPGDVNEDGKVNLADVYMMKSVITGSVDLSETQFKAADLDGDEKINISDMYLLKSLIMG